MVADRLHSLTVGDVARENRRRYPMLTAAVDGDVTLTYREFDERSTRLANALRDQGVTAGGRILWLGQNSYRVLETLVGAAKLGAVVCPANWRMSVDEIAFVVDDFDPHVVIWQDEEIGDKVRRGRARSRGVDSLWIQYDGTNSEYEALLEAGSTLDAETSVDPETALVGLYTAAYGGKPNAALLSHTAMLMQNLVVARVQQIDSSSVFLNSGPLFHVGTLMLMNATFHHGGRNVFLRRPNAPDVCRAIDAYGCTHAFIPRPLAEEIAQENREGMWDLGVLRHAIEDWRTPIATPSDAAWFKRPSGYGQTEVGGLVTFSALDPPGTGAAGRTSPLAMLRIVDADSCELPLGEVGEIVVRGPIAMLRYHDRLDLSEQRQRDGWHHTGDLGRREADGSITFVRPMSKMIKSGAENVYPEEVEKCIRSCPGVLDACVIGIPDKRWDQVVKAVIVAEPGADVTPEAVIEHCRASIASYKKPRFVEIVVALPRTASGFLDRDLVDQRHGGGGYPGAGR